MSESLRKALGLAEEHCRQLERELVAHRTNEQAIAEQAERLRTALASIGDAVITTDIESRITDMNHVAESLTGWTTADSLGQLLDAVFRIVNQSTRQTVESPVARALAKGVIVGLANHTVLIAKDGTERPIYDNAASIRRADGETVGSVLVFRDISERHRQDAELAEPERHFRTLAESNPQLAWKESIDAATPFDIAVQRDTEDQLRRAEQFNRSLMDGTADCVKVLDTDGRVVHMNAPGMCAMDIDDFGSLYGQEWWAIWPADSLHDIQASVTRAARGEVSSFEAFCPTAKGRPKWWEVTVSPVRDADGGKVVRLLAVSRDITDRRESEDRLRKSEADFRAIFEQSVVGMVQSSATTQRFVRVNTQFCEITGYSAEELMGMTTADLTFPEDRDADSNPFAPLLCGEVVSSDHETRYVRKDANLIWVHVNATLLRDSDGRPERIMAVIQDITGRKEAEADKIRLLEQAEGERARLADVFRHAPAFMCVLRGPDHVYELVNDRYYQLVGRRDVLGRTVRDAIPEVVEQGFVALLDNVYATGETLMGTGIPVLLARQPDEPPQERYLDLVYQALRDPSEVVTGIVIVGVDVTERNLAEAAVRLSEVKYRTLFESMDEGYCVIEVIFNEIGRAVDYRFEETNPAFEKHTGIVGAVGRTMREFVPDLETHWFEKYGRVVQTGEPVRFVDVAEAMARRWFDVYAYRLGAAGSNRVAVLFSDISFRQQTEDARRQSEQRYRAATLLVSDVIWTNSADGSMEGEQPGWGDFTGQSREEYQGYGWSKAVHPDDVQPTLDAWTQAVTEKREFAFEHRVRRRDGEWRACSIRAVSVLNADGTIREWIGVHTDITEQKRTEERLRQFAADMSEADHRKDEFLATLAHELRNPLAPIRTGLEVLKLAGGQVSAVEQTRSMMERQLTQMVRLIDDLMDVSRISRGQLALHTEIVSLAAILHSALEASRPLIEQMGHELTVTLPTQPLMVDADMTRLAQVFVNLLNNAGKYSERGGHIHLHVARDGSDVEVTVKDTGIGIAADQLPRIFDMFTQVDRSLERSQGGLGIGLTLVKRLVELHGGSVQARSEGRGHGSEFVVRLPLVSESPTPRASGGDELKPDTMSLRILVVDDSRDGADSLAAMLRILGNDVRAAYEGQEGVDVAATFRPDVILFDIGMPKLNGYEACRRIRQHSWGNSILLIAVTGWGQAEDRRRSHEAGFDHHMVKPVDPATLMKLLAKSQEAKA